MISKIRRRISSPLVLRVSVLTLVLVSAVGVSAHFQPVSSTHGQIHAQKPAAKKTVTRNLVNKPGTAAPVATPKPSAAPPKTTVKPAVTATTPRSSASTPKPQPVVTPSPSSNVSGLTPAAPVTPPSSPSSPATTTSYNSTNWSGYMAAGGNYTGISGSWTATSPTGNGSTTSADGTWIGIGGVTASDLIQVGTQNTITAGGTVTTEAFYELLPNVSQTVPGVTVTPGDSMSASIIEVSQGQWTINITDITNGQSYANTVAYVSSNSSAEWIEEDPSFSFRRQIPFDNFGTASFRNGSTVTSGSTVDIAGSNAQPITMVNGSGQAIATPSAIGSDGGSFSIVQH